MPISLPYKTNNLISKIQARTAKVAIIGLGYVGLPLATVFARAGYNVIGIDVDRRKVDAIREGHSYIEDVPSTLVHDLVATGHLSATTNYAALADCDIVSICVPTPLRKTGDPNISYIHRQRRRQNRYLFTPPPGGEIFEVKVHNSIGFGSNSQVEPTLEENGSR